MGLCKASKIFNMVASLQGFTVRLHEASRGFDTGIATEVAKPLGLLYWDFTIELQKDLGLCYGLCYRASRSL